MGVQRKFIRTFSYTVYFSFGWVGENKEEASKASWFEEIVCEAKNLVFFRLTFVYVHELLFKNIFGGALLVMKIDLTIKFVRRLRILKT